MRQPSFSPFLILVLLVLSSFMVVILSEIALLGKSFFNVTQRAVVRVAFRVDRGEVGEQPIGRDFFADGFPREVLNVGEVATAQSFADVFR